MKKQPRERKPTKFEGLSHAAEQQCAHHSSARIISRRAVMLFEIGALDEEIIALTGAASKARDRRAILQAMVNGMGQVLDKR
jgi:hypothetical protein